MTKKQTPEQIQAKIDALMEEARKSVAKATKLADKAGLNIHLGIGDVSQTYLPPLPVGKEVDDVDEIMFSDGDEGVWYNSYQYG